MATTGTHIPIGQLTKEVTLDIKIAGFTGWKIRLYIARALIVIACRIAGLNYHFEE